MMPHERKRSDGRRVNQNVPVVPRMDSTYGQRGALPGLDDSDNDDASAEAIAYLRSVRSEASAIPNLLIAPTAVEEESIHEADWSGQYLNGTYCAMPNRAPAGTNHGRSGFACGTGLSCFVHPEQVYHARLLQIYNKQRRTLRIPSTSSTRPHQAKCPIEIDQSREIQAEISTWAHNVSSRPPTCTQLASMSQDTVMWLLRHLPMIIKRSKWVPTPGTSGLEADNHIGSKGRNLGAWIWGLLARLDEVGMLSSEEVSIVREVGKRAGSLLLGTDSEQAASLVKVDTLSDIDEQLKKQTDESSGTQSFRAKRPAVLLRRNSSSDLSITDAEETPQDEKTSLPTSSSIGSPRTNDSGPGTNEEAMKGTLDMILTVVGECYGQRDLLVARNILWGNGVRQNT